jgi:predicted nucleic acid-binding protein
VIGLLIRAKCQGLVDSLQAELDRLQIEGGFWIEAKLYKQVLGNIGEENQRQDL